MAASGTLLCAPLRRLMGEHVSLTTDMTAFYEITEEIEYGSGPVVGRLFGQLYERVTAFNLALTAHSKREEEGLFPMMARHLAGDDKTIEVMEFEHEKAEKHLRDFLTEAARAGSSVSEEDAQAIAVYAVQAYTTLTQHFAKEELNLFPLAEKILPANEKGELERLFNLD